MGDNGIGERGGGAKYYPPGSKAYGQLGDLGACPPGKFCSEIESETILESKYMH